MSIKANSPARQRMLDLNILAEFAKMVSSKDRHCRYTDESLSKIQQKADALAEEILNADFVEN